MTDLNKIHDQTLALQRLGDQIRTQKALILNNHPEVVFMSSQLIDEESSECKVLAMVSEASEDIQSALEEYFPGKRVEIYKSNVNPEILPLIRLNYEREITKVLDELGYHDGLYMSFEVDDEGPYVDMRLSNDTQAARQALQEANPDVRFKFSKNDQPLNISLQP